MSAIIYWLAIRLYTAAIHIAALFNGKAKRFVSGRKQLLSRMRYAMVDERRPRVWMHCASLGEFEQGRPLLEKLRGQYPQHAFILTFFSPSGYEVRKDYEGADYVFYLPVDSPRNAKKFLDIVQPVLCIFVKYDLWYGYLSQIASRDIPLVLVSAIFRQGQPFFKWYGKLHRSMLHCFSHIFVQDPHSEQLLNRIGITHVSVAGDTRFDRVLEGKGGRTLAFANSFARGHKIIVAGSTWPEDDKLLYDVIGQLPAEWKLVLVPHDVHASRLESTMNTYGRIAVKYSLYNKADDTQRVLVIDSVGLLMQLYSYADVAWIGGGFGKEGVHNVLEAAVYGIPVAHGPVYEQYLEAKELIAAGGSVVAADAKTLTTQVTMWRKDAGNYKDAGNAAAKYVLSKTGATAKILSYLAEKNWLSVA